LCYVVKFRKGFDAVKKRKTANAQGFLFLNLHIMSTNTFSKEAETRLLNFFNHTIDPETMAKAIRQLNYLLALEVMRKNQTLQNEIDNIENSFYWLNELAEVLNPYLDLE